LQSEQRQETRLVNTTMLEYYRTYFTNVLKDPQQEYCEYTKNTNTEDKGVYATLAMISMAASIFVAWTIFYNKKLRQHPS
jgi:hypothetical protein